MAEFCVICGREMGPATKPYWVIDLEEGEVKGKAHKTCRDRLRSRDYKATRGTPHQRTNPLRPKDDKG